MCLITSFVLLQNIQQQQEKKKTKTEALVASQTLAV